jgi:hypothetical protein
MFVNNSSKKYFKNYNKMWNVKYIGKYFSAERILTCECRLTMISAGITKTYTV